MCVLAAGDSVRFTRSLHRLGIDTVEVRAGRDLSLSLVPALVNQISDYRPDLVHTHLFHADLYGQLAARIKGVAAVASFHSSNPFYRKRPLAVLNRVAYRRTKVVIAISEHVAGFLRDLGLVDSRRLQIVPYGIDAARWNPDPAKRLRVRRSFGMQGEVAVGVASRLFPNKGHEVLIKAFRDVIDEHECRLYIAGDGPLRVELERLASSTLAPSSYRFLGHVDDVVGLMNACDVMVFPTNRGFGEGFGLAALEAMAAGCPVIASAIDSLPEVVEEDVTGFLVDPGNPRALADAIGRLVVDCSLREKMGNAGRQRAESCFSLPVMVDSIIRIYKESL